MNVKTVGQQDQVVMFVQNVDAASITTGAGVAFTQLAASVAAASLGKSAVTATAGDIKNFIGVAQQDIALNGVGRVVCWGYAASVLLSQSVGSFTVTGGDQLRLGGQAGAFTSVITPQATSTQYYKYVVCGGMSQATVSNPQSYGTGIVRGL